MPRKTKDTVTKSLWMVINDHPEEQRTQELPSQSSPPSPEGKAPTDSPSLQNQNQNQNQNILSHDNGANGTTHGDDDSGNEKSREVKFEDALALLERQVRTLEQGGLPLEEAIRTFEQGVQMFKLASSQLRQAELRIKQVLESSGELRLEPFEPPDLRNLTGNKNREGKDNSV